MSSANLGTAAKKGKKMTTNKYLIDQWRERAAHWRSKAHKGEKDKYLLQEIWLARAGEIDRCADELEQMEKTK